jgi:hypothetical protein
MLKIIAAAIVVVVSFVGALFAMDWLWPRARTEQRPVLAEVPPLPPVTRTSVIVAPTAIALSALRDAMDAAAPRTVSGKRDNPLSELLSKADIGWTINRGPMALAGRSEALTISTPLNGTMRVTGQIATQAGNLTGTIGNLLGDGAGRGVQNLTGRVLDQRADIRGNVIVTSRPTILPTWRVEPHLTGQLSMGDSALSIAGIRLSVAKEVKPFLDRTVNEQVSALGTRVRNDPFLEETARREWAKMCRSISLGAAGAGMPDLWLELRPTRAYAAQPRIDASAVTLVVGVQAETRIVPTATTPDCPFPAQLEIVPQVEQGQVNIGVPIDVPFTEVNRLLAAQLGGKTFPEDKSGSVDITVKGANIAASGDRLLITLRVNVREKKSFFGFGADATVHLWGRPVLDREQQILRFTDIALDVESETAFGLLGAAARAAIPYLQDALVEKAVVDLKPFAANARKSIEAAVADFRGGGEGVRIDAAITDLRLVGIAYDATTLRVIAEADGAVKVAVTSLPGQ